MPWYRQGTVAVTNGQTTVTGVSTDFALNARVGDAFQGPDGRWYEVANIASSTVLSILPAYQGSTVAAGSYGLAPMQGYVKESADRLRQLVEQYGGTLALFGNATDVVTLRTNIGAAKSGVNGDITSITGLTTALSIEQGGTGATTAAAARTALNVMAVGAGGWLGASTVDNGNMNSARQTGLYSALNAINSPASALQLLSTDWGADPRWQSQLALGVSLNRAFFRSILKDQTGATSWAEFYHTGNTTRGSGGALSAASPILRIANVAGTERKDLLEHTFEPAGEWGVSNDEARGVTVERLGVGVYLVKGSLGLALEGWRIQDPCSPDGGRMLGITQSDQDTQGVVTIRLFKQRWTLDDDGEMHLGIGAPLEVPLNSWIDVRLEMPALPTPTEQPPA
ncbi:phage tail fiber protein [Pseudomonas mosselii]|uniref:Phage tail protein C-terminal domain-containing protein n=1 Tax=Pseudomonas mosselii TaxID=78327 RepID=A0A7W2JZ12_9PSED|nr:hypothetical protein [Pseudomonas mosselii]MBA6067705.1 hypothetical protein [Pseudomonas mosselii]